MCLAGMRALKTVFKKLKNGQNFNSAVKQLRHGSASITRLAITAQIFLNAKKKGYTLFALATN